MKMLILEGPDNLGKSTAITQLEQIFIRGGFKVHVMVHPNRKDWTPALEQYVMGESTAVAIERQYLITLNCMTQYSKIPHDTDIILSDRHCAVSSLVYFQDDSGDAEAYRDATKLALIHTHSNLGIDYVACMLLVGDRPFVEADATEHFEVSQKWKDICSRYNRLKYTDQLPNMGIEVCAIDAFSAKGKLVDIAAGLFAYALKHSSLPQPLSKGIDAPMSKGTEPDAGVSPVDEDPTDRKPTWDAMSN